MMCGHCGFHYVLNMAWRLTGRCNTFTRMMILNNTIFIQYIYNHIYISATNTIIARYADKVQLLRRRHDLAFEIVQNVNLISWMQFSFCIVSLDSSDSCPGPYPTAPPASGCGRSQWRWSGTVVTFPPAGWWPIQDWKSLGGTTHPDAAVPCSTYTLHKKEELNGTEAIGGINLTTLWRFG